MNSNFTESITQFERAIKSGHLSESESIASHLKLAQAYQKNGQFIEAARITDDIERTFSDASSIAGKLALSKAEQALQSGDVSGAISILENVKYSSGAALAAKKRLALIYLNDRRNESKDIFEYFYRFRISLVNFFCAHCCLLQKISTNKVLNKLLKLNIGTRQQKSTQALNYIVVPEPKFLIHIQK